MFAQNPRPLRQRRRLNGRRWQRPQQCFNRQQPAVAAQPHYEANFQYCDPITSLLQACRSATLANEIMAQTELEKTEFYNDFLRVDGLKNLRI